jgi:hypothetical protein
VLRAAQVSCGHRHAAAVTDDGELYSWGDNRLLQLGAVSPPGSLAAAAASDGGDLWEMDDVLEHEATFLHAAAADAAAAAAGRAPPRRATAGSHVPVRPQTAVAGAGACRFVTAACGGAHTLALTAVGAVLAWGDDLQGQCGGGGGGLPAPVCGLLGRRVVALAGGGRHSLAAVLAASGSDSDIRTGAGAGGPVSCVILLSWGCNGHGQLGRSGGAAGGRGGRGGRGGGGADCEPGEGPGMYTRCFIL